MSEILFNSYFKKIPDFIYIAVMQKCILQLLVVFFISTGLHAQKKPITKEINVITDNDNYDLELTDRYYSNGFIIQYNWMAKNSKQSVAKKIHRTELAHKVYNPYKNNESLASVTANLDRPYAGWFSASYGATIISKKQHLLTYTFTTGIMGPGALGEEVQQNWHKFIGLYKVYGWDEYQLKNEWGFNASAEYYHSILKAEPNRNFSAHLVSKATLGNTFTNVSAGALFKMGWLNAEHESGYWSGNLGANEKTFRKNEFIFFLEPTVQYQAYNATVQGGLFRKDKGSFTTDIEPIVFQTKTGIMITGNKMGFRWYYTFRGKEGSMMKKGEHWGTIGLSFRF